MSLDTSSPETTPDPTPGTEPVAPASPAAAPAAPSAAPLTLMDKLDQQEAELSRLVDAEQQQRAAGTVDPNATPAAAPAAAPAEAAPSEPGTEPAATPTPPIMIPKQRFDQVLGERNGLIGELQARDLEIARLKGIAEGRAAAAPAATPAAPAAPRLTPEQLIERIEARHVDIDRKYEAGELTPTQAAAEHRKLDRMEKKIVADSSAAQIATNIVRAHAPAAPAPPDVDGDIMLKQETAKMMAEDPWLKRVPSKVVDSFSEDVHALAKQQNIELSATPLGVWRYRYLLRHVLRENGMDRAYGGAPGAPAGTGKPTASATPAPGAAPIPAPRPTTPPALTRTGSSSPHLTTGITAERIAAMPFHEAAKSIPDEEIDRLLGLTR